MKPVEENKEIKDENMEDMELGVTKFVKQNKQLLAKVARAANLDIINSLFTFGESEVGE